MGSRMLIIGGLLAVFTGILIDARPNSSDSTTLSPSSDSDSDSIATTIVTGGSSDEESEDVMPTTTEAAADSSLLAVAEARSIPIVTTTKSDESSIRKCPHGDDESLNKCLRQILVDLRPKFTTGVPELNIPPMDPLKIANVAFQHGSGPVRVIASFSNVDVRGLSSYNKSDFSVDTKRHVLDFDLGIAQMQITGNYQLAGNLFFFPIGGSGSFWLNLGGITAKGQGKLGAASVNGKKTIVVRKIDIDLDISTIKLHLTNLFNGDPLLGNVINTFLNENAKEIFEEVRPQIGNQVGEMVSLLANRALANLPAEQFLDISEERLDSDA